MTTVIIPAAGDGSRFDSNTPKQLLDVGGVPLICRLAERVNDLGHSLYVMAKENEIAYAIKDMPLNNCWVRYPHKSRYLIETILHAPIQWASNFERAVVMLGDCVFSPEALDMILNDTAAPMFYGDWGEIFAFAFIPDSTQGWLEKAIKISEEHPDWGPAGKLWMLYRLMSGLSIYDHDEIRAKFFTWIIDYTTDFDTMEEYERFKRHVIDEGLLT